MPCRKTVLPRYRHCLATAVMLLAACTTVPMTNRQSFQMVPDTELNAMSRQEYCQVLSRSTLSEDAAQVRAVRRVGNRVARAAEDFLREQGLGHKVFRFQWEFNLIEIDGPGRIRPPGRHPTVGTDECQWWASPARVHLHPSGAHLAHPGYPPRIAPGASALPPAIGPLTDTPFSMQPQQGV